MSFLRPSTMLLRTAALRPALTSAPRASLQLRFATQDYGSGEGNPAGENPQKQGARGREDLEHPGPPPPKVAKQSSSSSSQSSEKSGGSDKGGSEKGSGKPQPKILNDDPPSKENESEDVKEHNKEVDQRAERAHEQVSNEDAKNDKVPKKFWSGKFS
ncbi:hypothetical protein CC80DRAFT_405988 [Byssothecium circinans]|uniref:Uncharacterized protein n=1 Tax=Byssothecium circinans TaxID=147558 RepID=A0A6A5U698_9PLEO|nr:hypothetical protein CC80DRAFT_405988 [Byssothecium circinans]